MFSSFYIFCFLSYHLISIILFLIIEHPRELIQTVRIEHHICVGKIPAPDWSVISMKYFHHFF